MLKEARKRAENLSNIDIKKMDITKLEFKDNSFDNVVATFVLCTLPEKFEKSVLNELLRVAMPNSNLYFLEYAYSKNPARRFFMKLTSPISKLFYGIRFDSTLPILRKDQD